MQSGRLGEDRLELLGVRAVPDEEADEHGLAEKVVVDEVIQLVLGAELEHEDIIRALSPHLVVDQALEGFHCHVVRDMLRARLGGHEQLWKLQLLFVNCFLVLAIQNRHEVDCAVLVPLHNRSGPM